MNQKSTLETSEDPKTTLEASEVHVHSNDIEELDGDKSTPSILTPEIFVKTTPETSEGDDGKTTLETSEQEVEQKMNPNMLKYIQLMYVSDPYTVDLVKYGCKFLVGFGVFSLAVGLAIRKVSKRR